MSGLLPSTPDISAAEEAEPRVIGVDDESADDLLAAMSSATARRVLANLHEEPSTPSALADRVDTSLQNVQYHLGKLEDADLVDVIDTVYSEKGREMSVYAPTDRPLVVVAGPTEETTSVRTALASLLGGLGILGVVGLLIQSVVGGWPFAQTAGGTADGASISAAPTATEAEHGAGGGISAMEATPTPQMTDAAASAGPADIIASLPPGALFVAGGAAILLVGFAVWYVRAARR